MTQLREDLAGGHGKKPPHWHASFAKTPCCPAIAGMTKPERAPGGKETAVTIKAGVAGRELPLLVDDKAGGQTLLETPELLAVQAEGLQVSVWQICRVLLEAHDMQDGLSGPQHGP